MSIMDILASKELSFREGLVQLGCVNVVLEFMRHIDKITNIIMIT